MFSKIKTLLYMQDYLTGLTPLWNFMSISQQSNLNWVVMRLVI